MPAPWLGVAQTTIQDYIKGQIDNTLRNYKLPALLQQKGLITYNNSGTGFEWVVKYIQKPMQQYASGVQPIFSTQNRWQRAKLDYRGYYVSDQLHEVDELMNKGDQALHKILANMASNLYTEMEQQFHSQFFVDGSATGYQNAINGFESFFGSSGIQPAGYVGTPNSTYAGLDCALGDQGGQWSTNGSGQVEWPRGYGDPEYDYWSPMIVYYDDVASFGNGGWAANCEKAMSFAIAHTRRNNGKDGMLDVFMLTPELFRQYKDFNRGRQRINVDPGLRTGLISMGFTDVIHMDGVEVTQEFGVASGVGYGLNISEMELRSMRSQLFEAAGPEWVIQFAAYLAFIRFNGNLQCNVRPQCKLRAT